MAYKIEMAKPVQKQLDAIKKSNAPAYKKAVLLMAELTEHHVPAQDKSRN